MAGMFTSIARRLVALLLALTTAEVVADTEYQLRHNPFARAFEGSPGDGGYNNDANASGDMELRAILFDDKRPMVNVGGNILELGDEYSGYVVREIRRDSAIFYREGRATLLQMEAGEDEIAGYADAN